MCFLRRIGKIPLKHKIKIEEVLKQLEAEKTLVSKSRTRKLKFFSHLKRHDFTVKNILEGKMKGKISRGRPQHNGAITIRSGQDTT